ncbi:MAG: RagB/SusD family nutrient uptake outer membrane protein [Muribaculaceae bacterium]|nr:RagB/SusD family nutrient uptake outer membrane protein [Muribaculaceae bacterium]
MNKLNSRIMQLVVGLILALCPVSAWAITGDVDGDGVVTASDITAIYNYLLNNDETFLATSDVDGDGVVTAVDVTLIYNILLGVTPQIDNEETLFARCYASLRSEENISGYGDPSICSFLRSMWQMNTLTTDEAFCTWSDYGMKEMNTNSWGSDLPQAEGLYRRLCANIDICNSYLSSTANHDDMHNAEIRTLRALYYYYLMDFFGKVPSNTYASVNTINAQQQSRANVFFFIEDELIECSDLLAEPMSLNYGRIDKAACALLLARLYLNMGVYVNNASTNTINRALNLAKQNAQYVMNSAYGMCTSGSGNLSTYQSVFAADNGTGTSRNEIILPIPFSSNDAGDFVWSGTTFLVAGSYGSNYESIFQSGLNSQWGGYIARPDFADRFNVNTQQNINTAPGIVANSLGDKRALFIYNNSNAIAPITESTNYYDGICYFKFSNRTTSGSVPNTSYADTDYPLIRYAEAPLILAEADARLNSGTCTSEGLAALNSVRARAGLSTLLSANLNTILNEWSKEFGFEGRRRIDLVRFGCYGTTLGETSTISWNQKGGTVDGQDFDISKNIFAIPAGVMAENSSYTQNSGYDIAYPAITLTARIRNNMEGYTLGINTSWTEMTSDQYIIHPNYEVQICANTTFAEGTYITIDVGNATSYNPGKEELKKYVKKLGTQAIKVRVHGYASGTGEAYSSVKSLLLNLEPNEFDNIWWLTGSCIGDGYWNNSDNPTNCSSMAPMFPNGDKLEYAGYFPSGAMFYILSTPGEWTNVVAGGNENGGQSYFSDYATSPITVSTEGYYKITLNPSTHQVTWTRLTSVNEYNSIGIIGYFSNWNTDVDMNMLDNCYDVTCHNWRLPFALDNDSELKFRANHEWYYYWGDDDFPIGNGTFDGNNIPASAGNYTVYFNDILGDYIFFSN